MLGEVASVAGAGFVIGGRWEAVLLSAPVPTPSPTRGCCTWLHVTSAEVLFNPHVDIVPDEHDTSGCSFFEPLHSCISG